MDEYINFLSQSRIMKMPNKWDSKLLASCGINCIICENIKITYGGCNISNDGKSKAI